ncbi:MAG: hypothetical protein NT099_00800 [Candidatus Saganbacteria bacterium]|nr:hypothetical protein [Candidatus Saganbacteria bacterium]
MEGNGKRCNYQYSQGFHQVWAVYNTTPSNTIEINVAPGELATFSISPVNPVVAANSTKEFSIINAKDGSGNSILDLAPYTFAWTENITNPLTFGTDKAFVAVGKGEKAIWQALPAAKYTGLSVTARKGETDIDTVTFNVTVTPNEIFFKENPKVVQASHDPVTLILDRPAEFDQMVGSTYTLSWDPGNRSFKAAPTVNNIQYLPGITAEQTCTVKLIASSEVKTLVASVDVKVIPAAITSFECYLPKDTIEVGENLKIFAVDGKAKDIYNNQIKDVSTMRDEINFTVASTAGNPVPAIVEDGTETLPDTGPLFGTIGKFSAAGTYTLTAKDANNKTLAVKTITVNKASLTNLTLEAENTNLAFGETTELSLKAASKQGDISLSKKDKDITWKVMVNGVTADATTTKKLIVDPTAGGFASFNPGTTAGNFKVWAIYNGTSSNIKDLVVAPSILNSFTIDPSAPIVGISAVQTLTIKAKDIHLNPITDLSGYTFKWDKDVNLPNGTTLKNVIVTNANGTVATWEGSPAAGIYDVNVSEEGITGKTGKVTITVTPNEVHFNKAKVVTSPGQAVELVLVRPASFDTMFSQGKVKLDWDAGKGILDRSNLDNISYKPGTEAKDYFLKVSYTANGTTTVSAVTIVVEPGPLSGFDFNFENNSVQLEDKLIIKTSLAQDAYGNEISDISKIREAVAFTSNSGAKISEEGSSLAFLEGFSGVGSYTLTAAWGSGNTKPHSFTVTTPTVHDVKLETIGNSIAAGGKLELRATAVSNFTGKTLLLKKDSVDWAIKKDGIPIDNPFSVLTDSTTNTAAFTTTKASVYTIKAGFNGQESAAKTITVNPGELINFTVLSPEITLAVSATKEFSIINPVDSYGNTVDLKNYSINWDPSLIDAIGNSFTAFDPFTGTQTVFQGAPSSGKYTVHVSSSNGIQKTITINVIPNTIAFQPNYVVMNPQESKTLTLVILGSESLNITAANIKKWEFDGPKPGASWSHESLDNIVFKAGDKSGTYTLKAMYNDLTAEATIIVKGDVANIRLDTTTHEVDVDSQAALTVTGYDAANIDVTSKLVSDDITWEVYKVTTGGEEKIDSKYVDIFLSSISGKTATFKTTYLGDYKVKVLYKGSEDEVSLKALAGEIESVKVVSTPESIEEGETADLIITAYDSKNNDVTGKIKAKQLSWSTDSSYAGITTTSNVNKATFTSVKAGTYNATVSYDNGKPYKDHKVYSDSHPIKVTEAQLASFTLEAQPKAPKVNETSTLKVRALSTKGKPMDKPVNADFTWSVSNDLATIDEQGILTAKTLTGICTVTAQKGDITSSTEVIVKAGDISGEVAIKEAGGLSLTNIIIEKGDQIKLSATAKDIYGNTIDEPEIQWNGSAPTSEYTYIGDALDKQVIKLNHAGGTQEIQLMVIPKIDHITVSMPGSLQTDQNSYVTAEVYGEDGKIVNLGTYGITLEWTVSTDNVAKISTVNNVNTIKTLQEEGSYTVAAQFKTSLRTISNYKILQISSGGPKFILKLDNEVVTNPSEKRVVNPNVSINITVNDGNGVISGLVKISLDGNPLNAGADTYGITTIQEVGGQAVTSLAIAFSSGFNLKPGEHALKIEAEDTTGEKSKLEIANLVVYAETGVTGRVANYPNPFKPAQGQGTKFSYTLTAAADIKIMVYDLTGRMVWQTFIAKDPVGSGTTGSPGAGGKAGYNEVSWNGINSFNEYLGNGVYVYVIMSDNKLLGRSQLAVAD